MGLVKKRVSSRFASRICTTQPAQLQRLARIVFKDFAPSKYRYYSVHKVKNKDADQTARMCRLGCIFVIFMQRNWVFSRQMPYYQYIKTFLADDGVTLSRLAQAYITVINC